MTDYEIFWSRIRALESATSDIKATLEKLEERLGDAPELLFALREMKAIMPVMDDFIERTNVRLQHHLHEIDTNYRSLVDLRNRVAALEARLAWEPGDERVPA